MSQPTTSEPSPPGGEGHNPQPGFVPGAASTIETETQPLPPVANASIGNGSTPVVQAAASARTHASTATNLWDRVPGGLLIVLASVAVVVAFFAVSQFSQLRGDNIDLPVVGPIGSIPYDQWLWGTAAVLLAVGAIIMLFSGIKRLAESSSPDKSSFQTSMLNSALIDIGVGAAVMIVIALLSDSAGPWNEIAVLLGVLATLLTAGIYATIEREQTWANRINPWQYGQLAERWESLSSRLGHLCPSDGSISSRQEAACREATAHLNLVAQTLELDSSIVAETAESAPTKTNRQQGNGDRWILGTGFVEMWERIHSAEAALYPWRPNDEIIASGVYDELRVLGSGMANEPELLSRLRRAVITLGGRAYLFDDSEIDPLPDQGEPAQTEAKQILTGIRRSIDQFRDSSRSGLARTRNHLIQTGLTTAVVAAILLALAILRGAGKEQIVAGVTFFLVASVVGLLWQLRTLASDTRSGEDDFGLDNARMVYTPVLSGLAGIGGVLIMALLYPTLNVALDPTQIDQARSAEATATAVALATAVANNGTPPPPETAAVVGAAQTVVTLPGLDQIFSLDTNRFGVIVAAVFGLTPDLLINRLQGQADRYKVDLENTSVQARNPALTSLEMAAANKTGKGA